MLFEHVIGVEVQALLSKLIEETELVDGTFTLEQGALGAAGAMTTSTAVRATMCSAVAQVVT
jgi:hypothetical protein